MPTVGSSIEIMSGWRCSCPPPCPPPCCPPPGSWSEPSLFHTVGNSTMMRLPPERRGVKPFAVGLSPFVCAPAAHQRIIGLVVKTLWRYKPGITKGFFLRWQSWPARGGVAGFSVFLLFRPELMRGARNCGSDAMLLVTRAAAHCCLRCHHRRALRSEEPGEPCTR